MKANMCGTPLRRATLSLAGSAHKEYKAPINRSTPKNPKKERVDSSMQSSNELEHSRNSKKERIDSSMQELAVIRAKKLAAIREEQSAVIRDLGRRFYGR